MLDVRCCEPRSANLSAPGAARTIRCGSWGGRLLMGWYRLVVDVGVGWGERVFLVVLIVGGKVADRGGMTILLILLLIGGI